MKKILLIDNYDSFTYNLKQLIMSSFKGEVDVKRNDEIGIEYLIGEEMNGLVISPGPGRPSDTGISMEMIRRYYRKLPILGVCLGMQCINEVFGGKTVKSPIPLHGKSSDIYHNGSRIFRNIPEKFTAARYHSLVIETVSDEITVTANTSDNIPMAIEHKEFPVFGVQFHPESFMTDFGGELIKNYLEYVK